MPLHERVLDRLADAAGEGEELVGAELLVAEEHDEVLEPGAADLGDGLVGEVGREVDAADLGAERARDRRDVDRAERLVRRSSSSSLLVRPRRCATAAGDRPCAPCPTAVRGKSVDDPQLLGPLLAGQADALERVR